MEGFQMAVENERKDQRLQIKAVLIASWGFILRRSESSPVSLQISFVYGFLFRKATWELWLVGQMS